MKLSFTKKLFPHLLHIIIRDGWFSFTSEGNTQKKYVYWKEKLTFPCRKRKATKLYELIDSLHLLAPYRQVYVDKSMFRILSVWECDEMLNLGHIDDQVKFLCGPLEA